MKAGSLFTGAGGLDMAVGSILPHANTEWFCESDPHAAATYSHHHPDVPNLGDIEAIDWTTVEPVDVMHGGFPCQDISNAGKRAGIEEGTRSGLWFRFADGIRTLRPELVLLENVAAIVANGGPAVVGSLAELGYDVAWTTLRASDVGCCHQRNRWFAVAWPADSDVQGLEGRDSGVVRERGRQWAVGQGGASVDVMLPTATASDWKGPNLSGGMSASAHGLATVVHTLPTPAVNDMGAGKTIEQWDDWTDDMKARHGNGNGNGKSLAIEAQRMLTGETYWEWVNRIDPPPGRTASGPMLPTPRSSDGPHGGPNQTGSGLQPAVRTLPTPKATNNENRQTAGQYGPNLGEALRSENGARWGDYSAAVARWEAIHGPAPEPTDAKGRLSPRFTEWMMGWPDGHTIGSRAQRLKQCGNGVVPHQAVAAYTFLLDRAANGVAS